MARDRATNVRPGRSVADLCTNCWGSGGLLSLPNGLSVAAQFVVPSRAAWRHLAIAPCPHCESTGYELSHRPPRVGQG